MSIFFKPTRVGLGLGLQDNVQSFSSESLTHAFGHVL